MKYILFGSNNEIVGRYTSAVNGIDIPTEAVEVSDELFWQTINEVNGVWKRDPETGEITKYPLPVPTSEKLAAQARSKRDHLINDFKWRINRHRDELDLGLEPTEPLEPLLKHVQALRDVPQQKGFPEAVEWPIEPSYLE